MWIVYYCEDYHEGVVSCNSQRRVVVVVKQYLLYSIIMVIREGISQLKDPSSLPIAFIPQDSLEKEIKMTAIPTA